MTPSEASSAGRVSASDPGDSSPDQRVATARKETVEQGPEDEVLNDDERKQFSWQSRYENDAWVLIRRESWYVVSVVLLSILALFLVWHGGVLGLLTTGCIDCGLPTLRRYGYVFFSGVLGGGLFGLKYLYKVVARGWWNKDRIVWRYASPLLSGGLAFGAGALAEAGIFGFASDGSRSSVSFVALGFIVGYFADKASGKMQEIAETMFGAHPPPRAKSAPKDKNVDAAQ